MSTGLGSRREQSVEDHRAIVLGSTPTRYRPRANQLRPLLGNCVEGDAGGDVLVSKGAKLKGCVGIICIQSRGCEANPILVRCKGSRSEPCVPMLADHIKHKTSINPPKAQSFP